MTLNTLDVPKPYSDTSPLSESMLDSMMASIETYAINNEANMKQLRLDLFSDGYAYGNDGIADLAKPLQDQMKFPNTLVYFDDFMEAAAALTSTVISNAHWTGAGTNGTQAIIAGANGVLQMDTTATGSSTSTLTFTTANFDVLNAPELECYVKIDNITNTNVQIGWRVDANDYIYFEFDTAVNANNIYLSTNNNAAGEVQTDTGVDLVTGTYFKFRIKIETNSTFSVYIDETLVAETHTGTIRSLATFKPWFYVDNKAAAESKKLDIDYVRILQSRG